MVPTSTAIAAPIVVAFLDFDHLEAGQRPAALLGLSGEDVSVLNDDRVGRAWKR
ncbi:MAG: hypothetical protein ACR2K2_01485 [Mycobacteriales bacterium]